jgi:hypothetical protein
LQTMFIVSCILYKDSDNSWKTTKKGANNLGFIRKVSVCMTGGNKHVKMVG